MARITFIQNIFREYPAFMALSADLRNSGHYADVVIARGEMDVMSAILSSKPDLVGFSPTAYDIDWCLCLALKLKKAGLEVILGGAMVTAKQDVIANPAIAFLCVGEGETCLRQLLNLKERGDNNHETIPNLVYKKSGVAYKNTLAPLIDDLDTLETPDHGLYKKYPVVSASNTAIFTFMRGCKFTCSFCFNHVLQRIYSNKPYIVRRRSPESAIAEIEKTNKDRKGLIKLVRLYDSTLLNDTKWAKEFLMLYRVRIRLPFICFAHPSEINSEMSSELKKSGCIEIGFSIESGSSNVRNKVLRKGSTDKQINKAGEDLKKNRVPFVTFNMLGSPGESWENILETIEVNRKINPLFAWGSLTQIYSGTILESIARKLEPEYFKPSQKYGVLDYRHPKTARIMPLLGAFPFIIRFPKTSKWLLGTDTTGNRQVLRVMSLVSFFMQCKRPALSIKEFIRHYIIEEGQGAGYY